MDGEEDNGDDTSYLQYIHLDQNAIDPLKLSSNLNFQVYMQVSFYLIKTCERKNKSQLC